MDSLSKIKQSIRNIAGNTGGILTSVFPAKIKEANGAICTVLIGDLELTDVRLRAVLNNSEEQLLITPKKDSYVLVTDLSGGNLTELAVLQYSEIEEISLKIGNQTLQANKGGFVFNGGKFDGLVKIKELTQKLNDLTNKFNSHIHATTATIGASAAVGVISATTSQAQAFDKSDYEDIKIKH
jgi:hypothetical protein